MVTILNNTSVKNSYLLFIYNHFRALMKNRWVTFLTRHVIFGLDPKISAINEAHSFLFDTLRDNASCLPLKV
jgi:hypothetical protein